MKKIPMVLIAFILSAIACVIAVLYRSGSMTVVGLAAYPFEWVASLIRSAAHVEPAGNVLALLLFASFASLPLIPAFKLKLSVSARIAMLLIGCAIGFAMYAMIVPDTFLMPDLYGAMNAKGYLGIVIWTMILLYAAVPICFFARRKDGSTIMTYIRILMIAFSIVMAVSFVLNSGIGVHDMLSAKDSTPIDRFICLFSITVAGWPTIALLAF